MASDEALRVVLSKISHDIGQIYDELRRARNSEIPRALRSSSDLSDSHAGDVAGIARAVQQIVTSNNNSRMDADIRLANLDAHIASLHAYAGKTHTFITRHAWMRHPATYLVVTAASAALGGYLAAH